MTENGVFVLGRPATHLHDILWVVHDEKIMVEARARKISESSPLQRVVGAEQRMEVCMFLSYTYAHGCEALGSN